MASPLPFALRVAAGLVSDTVDVVRRLPSELTTLPVTLVGRAAKLSFELNQQLTGLAVRGDKLLGALHQGVMNGADEPPERTAWSTIDDEDEVAALDPQAAARWEHAGPTADSDPAPGARAAANGAVHGGTGIDGYELLKLADLRDLIPTVPIEQLTAALTYEQAHRARPAFLTLLTNRLSTLAPESD